MDNSFAAAIADCIVSGLTASSDRIARFAPPREWPILAALEVVEERLNYKCLLQRPFAGARLPVPFTIDAGEATSWRNQVGRDFAVLVLGHPGANLDAGLRDLDVIDPAGAIVKWKATTLQEFGGLGDLGRPGVAALLEELFDAVANRLLSAANLLRYLDALRSQPAFETVISSLWLLGLFPDSRVLDTGSTARRLERNISLVDQLRAGQADLVARLRQVARLGTSPIAERLLLHLESDEPSELEGLELSEVERLLYGDREEPTPPPLSPKNWGLFEVLNQVGSEPDKVRQVIDRLRDHISSGIAEELSAPFASAGLHARVSIKIDLDGLETDESHLFDLEADPVVTAKHAGDDLPLRLSEANDRQLRLSQWALRVAEAANVDDFSSLRRRLHFLQHIPSVEDTFALFLLLPSIREDVLQYCRCWQNLVSEIAESSSPNRRSSLLSIQTLEVLLDAADSPQWLALSMLHPYRLEPIARVAEYCDAVLVGQAASPDRLGDAARWMLDRSLPAYPAYYFQQNVLHLSSHVPLYVFRNRPTTTLPRLTDSRGLERTLKSVLRYSPWLHSGLSILVVNPPPGNGVRDALQSLQAQVNRGAPITVYHAHTQDLGIDGLATYDGEVHYLDRNWLNEPGSIPYVDLAVLFSPDSATSHMATADSWAAAPGTHLVLQLSVDRTDDVFDVTARPRIDVDPSADNGIVNAVQSIYKHLVGGQAPHAAIEPISAHRSADSITDKVVGRTEWIATARPGPFGAPAEEPGFTELGFIGRSMVGRYAINVFAGREVYPVRRYIETALRDTPVATLPTEEMAGRLIQLARRSARSLLMAADHPIPSLGELVGLNLASSSHSASDHHSVALALDDLGWTRAWLGNGHRPDFLVVDYGLADESITLRVVECKTSQSVEPLPLRESEPTVREALRQVDTACRALEAMLQGTGALAEDLHFSSFVEHLFSVLLSSPQLTTDIGNRIIELSNRLASRSLVPKIEPWIFIVQPGINRNLQQARIGDAHVVGVGAPAIEELLTEASTEGSVNLPQRPTNDSELVPPLAEGAEWVDVHGGENDGPSESLVDAQSPHGTSSRENTATSQSHEPRGSSEEEPIFVEGDSEPPQTDAAESLLNAEAADLARRFIAAMELHGAAVADSRPRFVRVGPSLISLGVHLLEGSSLQPIRSRLGDIAREVGLGDRERELWTENSSEPGVIRVLLPRPNREYPHLPNDPLGPIQGSFYIPLYLGQGITGTDYTSALESWPHMLVAGTTGSGKTTLLRTLLKQVTRLRPTEISILIADGKGDTDYLGLVPPEFLPEGFSDVVLGPDNSREAVEWGIEELERRSRLIHRLARNSGPTEEPIKAADIYKQAIESGTIPPIQPLLLVIDEFADIMLTSKQHADSFMSNVQRLTQIGRSRLMHVLLATQRPDRNTIRGAVRANFDARIALRLPTAADSMTILGTGGAEKLLSHGDMLFRASSGQVVRLQGYSL